MGKIKNIKWILTFKIASLLLFAVLIVLYFFYYLNSQSKKPIKILEGTFSNQEKTQKQPAPKLDEKAYYTKLNSIANIASGTNPSVSSWPTKTPLPNAGAILPFNRIIAYYGNLYSKNMGILGEYPKEIMLEKLKQETKLWNLADPGTPAIPALHYIAVVAQAGPGKDGLYRTRMPETEIKKVIEMAKEINGLVFLDIQVGLSSVQKELPFLEKYLSLPNVHLGIDPEFSMKNSARPGTAIGTLDAEDINFAANFLAQITKDKNLPPKILIIHRFTQKMLTNYQSITPLPEVQIVINMDGFGAQAVKLNTYKQYIYKEPVQFTGFKLFYKNDSAKGKLLSPEEILKLSPIPVYIQYQ